MAITIRDVARAASLSCETILEVLVSPSSLEPEVVRHVMRVIRETGYLETFSRWKGGSKGSMVAVISSSVDSLSGTEIYRGIDRAMSALGLNLNMMTFPTRHSPALREELLASLLPFNMIDAVITLNVSPSESIVERYKSVGKALVLCQSKVQGSLSVLLENQKGMSMAVDYLYNRGCRRIALMNGPSSVAEPGSSPSERLIGYLMALHRLGMNFDEKLVYETQDYDGDSGAHGFEYFFGRRPLPDGLVCASGDMTAIGFITEARKNGVQVPSDIAVIGYDDLPLASLVSPALTTIRQRLMIAGAGALVLALESAVLGPGSDLIIVPEIVPRETA